MINTKDHLSFFKKITFTNLIVKFNDRDIKFF